MFILKRPNDTIIRNVGQSISLGLLDPHNIGERKTKPFFAMMFEKNVINDNTETVQ